MVKKGLWLSLSKSENSSGRPLVLAAFLPLILLGAAPVCAREKTAPIFEGQPQSLPTVGLSITTAKGAVVRYQVEVAASHAEQAIGLMYRKSLSPNAGMIFPMRPMRPASFWMANTYIPLDIIFIAPDGRIESIAQRTTPLSLEPVSSRGPVVAVLELAGGATAAAGIAVGDKVAWPLP